MGAGQEALMQVRATLCARIDSIADQLAHLDQPGLCGAVDSIRQTAQEYQLAAVAMLARSLEASLANGERGAVLLSHLDLMREAVGCEQLGETAVEAFLAAASVHLADGSSLRRY